MTEAAPKQAPLRAAVVDDERLTRAKVRQTLEAQGYEVEEGENGAAGLRLAQTHPDVLVLDLNLPDLTGLAVCRAIRGGLAPDVPVVFLTASDDEKTIVSCLQSGANDYVSKPFAPAVLAARVEAVVRTSHAERARRRFVDELNEAYHALREARAEVVLQHRLSGLGILAAGIAHEMNSPLGALIASLAFVREGGRDESERQAALTDAGAAAERIAELVRRMRSIAGSGERALRTLGLRERIEQVAKAVAGGLMKISITGPEVHIEMVETEIREILAALIENAVQATSTSPDPTLVISLAVRDHVCTMTLEDNGPGIDPADLPFLFDPFFTRKRTWKTAGLGLAIAQAAAQRHGGSVHIDPCGALGGARAILRLPLSGGSRTEAGGARALLADLRGDR